MTGWLRFRSNNVITAVTGFASLREVGTHISIGGGLASRGNAELVTFPDLDALETIGGRIFISLNTKLTALPAFPVLRSIGENLFVSGNSALTNFSSFDVLESVGGPITISSNPQLAECCILLPVFETTIFDVIIARNARGCRDEEEILTTCSIINEHVTITSDGDVPDDLEFVTRITGNLTINGTISSFPDFPLLEVVEGNILIDNITTSGLTTLENIFPSLDSAYRNLTIQNQSVVRTITGFGSLRNVGGDMNIGDFAAVAGNASITSLPAFDALRKVEGTLYFYDNDALTTISGFGSLTDVENTLAFDDNINLTTISGFELLASIGNDLVIQNNAALSSVSGFELLASIGNDLVIQNNTVLSSVSGFELLASIGNDLVIQNNAALSSVSGFSALTKHY